METDLKDYMKKVEELLENEESFSITDFEYGGNFSISPALSEEEINLIDLFINDRESLNGQMSNVNSNLEGLKLFIDNLGVCPFLVEQDNIHITGNMEEHKDIIPWMSIMLNCFFKKESDFKKMGFDFLGEHFLEGEALLFDTTDMGAEHIDILKSSDQQLEGFGYTASFLADENEDRYETDIMEMPAFLLNSLSYIGSCNVTDLYRNFFEDYNTIYDIIATKEEAVNIKDTLSVEGHKKKTSRQKRL